MARYKLRMRKKLNISRVVAKISATILALYVGGTIVTEIGNVMVNTTSPFYKGLTLIGWTIGAPTQNSTGAWHTTCGGAVLTETQPTITTCITNTTTFSCNLTIINPLKTINNISLKIWNSSGYEIKSNLTKSNPLSYPTSIDTIGSYLWTCFAYDTNNELYQYGSNYTIVIENSPPTATINLPTNQSRNLRNITTTINNITNLTNNNSALWQGQNFTQYNSTTLKKGENIIVKDINFTGNLYGYGNMSIKRPYMMVASNSTQSPAETETAHPWKSISTSNLLGRRVLLFLLRRTKWQDTN